MPSFQRADLLPYSLHSIRRQVTSFTYEILVLNDGLHDATAEVCRQFAAGYIFTGERNANGIKWQCPAPVINQGVAVAQADTILIMCPEMYLIQDTILERLVAAVASDPNIIAITKGYDDLTGRFLEHLKWKGDWSTFNPRGLVGPLHTRYPFCLCMSKIKFNSLGGYDPEFTAGIGFDDTDFYFRAVKSGALYFELDDLEVIHLYHDRYNRAGIDQATYNQLLERNKQLYITKNNTRDYL